jgi:cytosine/adenosine deaminase-related metal-dependent hydrolase
MAPIHDPVAAVTLCADVSNVESVLVAGEFRKRDGRLLADVARARELVDNSRDYLVAEADRRKAAAV